MERKTQISVVWGVVNVDGFSENQVVYHGNDIPAIGSRFSYCLKRHSEKDIQVVEEIDGIVKDVKYHYEEIQDAGGREIRGKMCISILIAPDITYT